MLLRFKGGSYDVTDHDRLWLLRAVQAEGAPQAQVARALVNCFAMLRGVRKYGKSLADFVRSYSQPVNPRWYPDGDLYLQHVAKLSGSQLQQELARARARAETISTRSTFTTATSSAVNAALSSGFASDVTDYSVPSIDASKKGYAPRSEPIAGQNRFWSRLPQWPGYSVDGGAPASSGGTTLVVLVALVGWFLLRRGA